MFNQLIISLIYVYLLNFINSLPTNQRYARLGHASALIDGKLYFMCGGLSTSNGQVPSRDLFYLDVSQPFTNNLPPLVDIQSNLPVNIRWPAVNAGGGHNRSTIFSFGGRLFDLSSGQPVTNHLVFTFP